LKNIAVMPNRLLHIIHAYVFIDLAAKLAGLWCTIYIKSIANIK